MQISYIERHFDRGDLQRNDPAAIAALIARDDALLLTCDGCAPAIGDMGELQWSPATERRDDASLALLGMDSDGRPHFVELPAEPVPAGNVRASWPRLTGLNDADLTLYASARSLIDWHARHGFCARCGSATSVARAGWMRRCPSCSAEHFPRVDPVVIMLAQYGDRVLLGRGPTFPEGRYSALAGFVEPGESIENAVARELKEEVGIVVDNVRYIGSQAWPFPSSLMIGCFAEARSDALELDTNEIEDAIWVDADEVRAALAGQEGARFTRPFRLAIARHLIEQWLDGQSGQSA